MENRIFDTALIFEGGGMRATYSAGMVDVLIEEGLFFNMVAGVSAGCTLLVNYVTRDRRRLWQSLVGLAVSSQLGGMRSFLKGRGYFDAPYIYEASYFEELDLVFRQDRWDANPAEVAIGAYNASQDKMVYWTKKDLTTTRDIGRACRASSTIPLAMPGTYIRGDLYLDGGLKESIPLSPALKLGYDKFFIMCSQPKGYRKDPVGSWTNWVYPKLPHVRRVLKERPQAYNARLDEMEALEAEGKAFIVYPDQMPVGRGEMDPDKLQAAYEAGQAQARRDLPKWKAFLFKDQEEV